MPSVPANPSKLDAANNLPAWLRAASSRLDGWIESQGFRGWDPYDALNSPVLKFLSFGNQYLRMVYTQTLKRLPVNLRPVLLVPKGTNPKALGLFLSGYVKLHRLRPELRFREILGRILGQLDELKSDGYSGLCWGYNFDWQNRLYLFPKYTPTIVNTSFIANGMLDVYELLGDPSLLERARSACEFILNDLYATRNNGTLCFGYTPMDRSCVHNANMLGARLLARVYAHTGESVLADRAIAAATYTVQRQNRDGSWFYGEADIQKSIDNYHTGFVLESLFDVMTAVGDGLFLEALERGLRFYEDHFFLPDGTPKYYHDKVYPIDVHSFQALVTLSRLRVIRDNSDRLRRIASWMVEHMQAPAGHFYFQKGKYGTNRISYLRWNQAWAFHGLTTYQAYLTEHRGN